MNMENKWCRKSGTPFSPHFAGMSTFWQRYSKPANKAIAMTQTMDRCCEKAETKSGFHFSTAIMVSTK